MSNGNYEKQTRERQCIKLERDILKRLSLECRKIYNSGSVDRDMHLAVLSKKTSKVLSLLQKKKRWWISCF